MTLQCLFLSVCIVIFIFPSRGYHLKSDVLSLKADFCLSKHSLIQFMHGNHHHHQETKHNIVVPSVTKHNHRTNESFSDKYLKPVNLVFAGPVFVVSAMSLIRKYLRPIDIGIIMASISLSIVFKPLKSQVSDWIQRIRTFSRSVKQHTPKPSKRSLNNAADRVTIFGIVINIILSVSKFAGGILCHSAVLVADAGHSLSDLFSDFITLWAVQIARLPPDEDHPYGHGKFESIGSLLLSLTLIGAGISVGTWSYSKLVQVIIASRLKPLSSNTNIEIPTWPALLLSTLSIISKEWLFRVTRNEGHRLNSQILLANAWHHRSDAFSSVLSLISITFAIILPKYVFVDAAAGILIAGMICLGGFEIFIESVKQLTDTTDKAQTIENVARSFNDVNSVVKDSQSSLNSGPSSEIKDSILSRISSICNDLNFSVDRIIMHQRPANMYDAEIVLTIANKQIDIDLLSRADTIRAIALLEPGIASANILLKLTPQS